MASQDKNKLISDLIEIGKQRGELTTQQINDLLEEFDFDVEQVDKLYEKILELVYFREFLRLVINSCNFSIGKLSFFTES